MSLQSKNLLNHKKLKKQDGHSTYLDELANHRKPNHQGCERDLQRNNIHFVNTMLE
jgi:hypothetical protein